jgi:hypothetical protein
LFTSCSITIEQSSDQIRNQAIKQSRSQTINKPIKRAINQRIKQSIEETLKHPNNRTVESFVYINFGRLDGGRNKYCIPKT